MLAASLTKEIAVRSRLYTAQDLIWELVKKITELVERKVKCDVQWIGRRYSGQFEAKVTYTSGEVETFYYELNLGEVELSVGYKTIRLKKSEALYLCPGTVRDLVTCDQYRKLILDIIEEAPRKVSAEETDLLKFQAVLRTIGRTEAEQQTRVFEIFPAFHRQETVSSMVWRLTGTKMGKNGKPAYNGKTKRRQLLQYGYGVPSKTKARQSSRPSSP